MQAFQISSQGKNALLLVEREAWEGVKKVAGIVAEDLRMVTGVLPEVKTDADGASLDGADSKNVILAATVGRSPLLERLCEEGKIDRAGLSGKREVYLWQIVERPFADAPQIERMLVIAGSDKRGTIYGLFSLSEYCGVSPLIYWGDVTPARRPELSLRLEEPYLSKEPSVEYRGFFINDEWPAFGNWCNEQFGGINAKAYEKVFELLLRLKGNYLWPAMWNSVFSEDGPGIENARLADIYGVVMGASHHEPMCRAGAEWQRIYKQYGENSAWNFVTNEKAITAFWEDGLLRNREFENVITIGMRGENDSKLMSEDATLADNIEVIKKAIRVQHELIKKHVNGDLSKVPRMLAIYKEVEDYYYGDATCAGLKEWEELDDVILLLCEDNFGNTRGLPEAGDRHPGGYGMYYHFDYHGGPVSYEWQSSARLTKTWEQMTQAYEFGVRKLWIVNVGDLKAAEYPLSYFMNLAYDYETYGKTAPNQTENYLEHWIDVQFQDRLSGAQKADLKEVIDGFSRWCAARRQEAMNQDVYHPVNYREAERVRDAVLAIAEKAEALKESMPEDCLTAYCSMIYYPAAASLNLIAMHAEAGMNAWLAEQGSLRANPLGESIKKRIRADRGYVDAYHALAGGKWNHMMDSAHTGFRSWNDYNWTYPAVREVIPTTGGRAFVRFSGSALYCLGQDWGGAVTPKNDDFCRPDVDEVVIDIDSRGEDAFDYAIDCDADWLEFSKMTGRVEPATEGFDSVTVRCDRDKLSGGQTAHITVTFSFDGGKTDSCKMQIAADRTPDGRVIAGASPLAKGVAFSGEEPTEGAGGVFVESQGCIVMEASHYQEKSDVDGAGFRVIRHLGRMGDAVKVFPVTVNWMEQKEHPWVAYDFEAKQEGTYHLELWIAPRNPVQMGAPMRIPVSVNEDAPVLCNGVSETFRVGDGGWEWGQGVLNNIRKCRVSVAVKKGLNRLYLYGGDPGIVTERILLYPEGTKLPESYLGPAESWRVQTDGIE